MAQLKFKDCGFSLDLRNWGIFSHNFCHVPTQEPTENRQVDPRLEAAHVVPSFLLFIKLHWQHLALCGRAGAMWCLWLKCQLARAAAPLGHGAIPCEGKGAGPSNAALLLGEASPEDNLHLPLNEDAGLSGFLPADM